MICVLVVKDFWFEVVVERVFEVVEVFHLNAETGELFFFLRLVLALLAADDGSLLSVEESLHEVVRWDCVFYAVQEEISELVNVHLHVDAGIASLDALESLEEVRIEVRLPTVTEMDKDLLELIDEVFLLVVVLRELGFEHFEAEEIDVEELLHEGVDVADGVRISESNSALKLHLLRHCPREKRPCKPLLLLRLLLEELQQCHSIGRL